MSAVEELRTMLDSEFFPDEIDSSAWIVEHGEKILALVEAAQAAVERAERLHLIGFAPLAAALAAVGPGEEAAQ